MKNEMRKVVLVALMSVLIAAGAYAEELLSEDAFAKAFVQVVRELHPDAKVELVGYLEVSVTMPDDQEMTAYLDNAYANYRNDPQAVDEVLATYAGNLTVSRSLDEAQLVKERIFPVIKDQRYIDQIAELMRGTDQPGLVFEQLNEVLYVVYAFDKENAIQFLTGDNLEDLSLEKAQLRALAKSNLKAAIPSLKLQGDPAALSMLVADGTYEASFILFDSMWTKEQFPVSGDIVVYIPTRDLVLITGSEDKVNLEKVHSIVYDPQNQWSHGVADVGFVRKNDRWEVFKP